MATLDRIEPTFTAWTPSASGIGIIEDDEYIGRHRKREARRTLRSVLGVFYVGRHRRR